MTEAVDEELAVGSLGRRRRTRVGVGKPQLTIPGLGTKMASIF